MDKILNTLVGESWKNLKKIIVFGYGRQGKKAIETLRKDFSIVAVIDNDSKKCINKDGMIVKNFDESKEILKKHKVIVATTERFYDVIFKQLESIGLRKNIDFSPYQQFVIEWYFRYKNKIYIPKTDLPVTSYCSLNCENCHIFIPYWKEKTHYDLGMLKNTVDQYFRYVDFVLDMDILGGEPFVYPNIGEIIKYLGKYYREKIGYLGIITNGTIIPSDDVLDLMKEYQLKLSISDYSLNVGYSDRVDLLCERLDEKGIDYIRNSNITWFDFRLPTNEPLYCGEKAKEHMNNCNSIYHVIFEGKFYACGTAWAAERSGLFPVSEDGFVDLTKENCLNVRNQILECAFLRVRKGYLDFCQVCGGFGSDNTNIVPTAKQILKEKV